MEVEKELNIHGQVAIKDEKQCGIGNFNNKCRESVMKYENQWKYYVETQGRWVDFENSYKTMDLNYMESVIWAFKSLYKKKLIYQDCRVMPYSWKCQTPVSNFETRMDNAYRQKESKSVYVKVRLKEVPHILESATKDLKNIYLVIWTTTPWTLPSNLAIAINREIKYTLLTKNNNGYIVASNLADKIEKIII
jgi:isoleucyl-tRNA synthetase